MNVDEGECQECHALVPWQKSDEHRRWHYEIQAKIDHLYSLVDDLMVKGN